MIAISFDFTFLDPTNIIFSVILFFFGFSSCIYFHFSRNVNNSSHNINKFQESCSNVDGIAVPNNDGTTTQDHNNNNNNQQKQKQLQGKENQENQTVPTTTTATTTTTTSSVTNSTQVKNDDLEKSVLNFFIAKRENLKTLDSMITYAQGIYIKFQQSQINGVIMKIILNTLETWDEVIYKAALAKSESNNRVSSSLPPSVSSMKNTNNNIRNSSNSSSSHQQQQQQQQHTAVGVTTSSNNKNNNSMGIYDEQQQQQQHRMMHAKNSPNNVSQINYDVNNVNTDNMYNLVNQHVSQLLESQPGSEESQSSLFRIYLHGMLLIGNIHNVSFFFFLIVIFGYVCFIFFFFFSNNFLNLNGYLILFIVCPFFFFY